MKILHNKAFIVFWEKNSKEKNVFQFVIGEIHDCKSQRYRGKMVYVSPHPVKGVSILT